MMNHVQWLLVVVATSALAGCATAPSGASTSRALGWQVPLGNGTVASYVEVDNLGAPTAIGVVWSQAALDGLPTNSQDYHCSNRNPDGTIGGASKCQHTFEYAIPLPDALARRSDIPFKWVLLNWNPAGHIPQGVYDVPHFDVHFEMVPIADIFAIEAGSCGPEFVRCDQFRIGKKPLPPNYVPTDYRDVDAVVPAMGNHLIDLTGPEFNKQPFTRSWIYGVYDGKVIFYEEMVTRAFLLTRPSACNPIKAPKAVALGGYYPTVSCVRYDPATGDYRVSMERFVMREASEPDPIAAAK